MKIQEKGELNHMYEGVDIYDLREEKSSYEVPFEGINTKNAIVIYQTNESEELPEDELLFLEKILGAVNLKLEEVVLINIAQHKVSFSELKNNVVFTTMITFGIWPGQISLNINNKRYCEYSLLNTKVLFADSLQEIMRDPQKKVLLWKELQTLFEIGHNA